jgi:hypothetical protein
MLMESTCQEQGGERQARTSRHRHPPPRRPLCEGSVPPDARRGESRRTSLGKPWTPWRVRRHCRCRPVSSVDRPLVLKSRAMLTRGGERCNPARRGGTVQPSHFRRGRGRPERSAAIGAPRSDAGRSTPVRRESGPVLTVAGLVSCCSIAGSACSRFASTRRPEEMSRGAPAAGLARPGRACTMAAEHITRSVHEQLLPPDR